MLWATWWSESSTGMTTLVTSLAFGQGHSGDDLTKHSGDDLTEHYVNRGFMKHPPL